jgi:hypothetical protein
MLAYCRYAGSNFGLALFSRVAVAPVVGRIAYNIEFMAHRPDHLNQFGHLLRGTEFWMFSLPVAAVFVGFFELMMREKAGLPRPPFGRNWSGQKSNPATAVSNSGH